MPSLIVLRLHPVKPTTGAKFTEDYLKGLSITARDVTFADPNGTLIGEAKYLDPPNTAVPEVPDSNTGIVQHFRAATLLKGPQQAVATAVIKDDKTHPEHGGRDILLEIKGRTGAIVHRQIHYNVVPPPQQTLPSPAQFSTLAASLYVAIPSPEHEWGPSVLELPDDGTPPNFDALKKAVQSVLAGDPGGTPDLTTLTRKQCRHIAYEIVWNRKQYPPPEPAGLNLQADPERQQKALEEMYTLPFNDMEKDVSRHQAFEGELAGYYATHTAQAERLSGLVFSLSAAVACEEMSKNAARLRFRFPIFPKNASVSEKIREAEVTLIAPKGPNPVPVKPEFFVPAEYFYALGAVMPQQITAQERYQMALLSDEQRNVTLFETALALNVMAFDKNTNGDTLDTVDTLTIHQAARRLRSLAIAGGIASECEVNPAPIDALHKLIRAWLDFKGKDISDFWKTATPTHDAAHLDLVLRAMLANEVKLIEGIKAWLNVPGVVAGVEQLAAKTAKEWTDWFLPPPTHPPAVPHLDLLPAFTAPGTPDQRIKSFLLHVRRFFEIQDVGEDVDLPTIGAPPSFDGAASDLLARFFTSYNTPPPTPPSVGPLVFGAAWDEARVQAVLTHVASADPNARAWLERALRTINELYMLAEVGVPDDPVPDDLRFSIMEALYARGFTNRQEIHKITVQDFQTALTGSVAYDHASVIHDRAHQNADAGEEQVETVSETGFRPINPDGTLVNCIPAPHRSPLGPVAYLHEMLKVSQTSTCEEPFPENIRVGIRDLMTERRGPLGDLFATRANLETTLPLIDLVNECLEGLAANLPSSSAGVVYDTAGDEVGGHKIKSPGDVAQPEPFRHDPIKLFEALPEHSTPATPVKQSAAYNALKRDFSSPVLPYSQSLDVCRSYLRHLRTSRYAVMRRFRKNITEFVLDPSNEPATFQRHLWRYPVRIEIGREYLGITSEEFDMLFTRDLADTPSDGRLLVRELYGFPSHIVDNVLWTGIVTNVSEFLKRTNLTYCQFLDLWKAEFVKFHREGENPQFPDCEPCYLEKMRIEFANRRNPNEELKRLAVFIRLWHKLQSVHGAKYSFLELRDICHVLHLFNEGGAINADFIRQLVAFQTLRDHFALALIDDTSNQHGTMGADRTHLLALWVGETARMWAWAVEELLDQVQHYARARHKCACRPPEFIKLLAENLDPLSRLAGFDPDKSADTWHACPTHTLRFVELLSKIYASDFGVGEILFLFTADEHVRGDDPFPLQTQNEAFDSPLGLPDDSERFSLWALRRKLLCVEVSEEEAASWSWARVEATLQEEFGFVPPTSGNNSLLALAEHFFPSMLEACGCTVDLKKRQYRVDLASTVPLMWNTAPDGPFRYDTSAHQLWTQLPLKDEAVFAKLSRIRPLTSEEQQAVRELYFLPRADLVPFAFIFGNFAEAGERLIQEPDEGKRWAYFQREFARCYVRCKIIAEHLACHVAAATEQESSAGLDLAWRVLQHLLADENKGTAPWESDSGQLPDVTWTSLPNGGAFAALLGLTGTGLHGQFTHVHGVPAWREVRGPMDAFGPIQNAWNSPVPTIIPSMTLTLSSEQEHFIGLRNGFALSNSDGIVLGGVQGFSIQWSGVLLVEHEGMYEFRAGAPTPNGKEPDFDSMANRRWRVILKRGQRTWIVLSHRWPDEQAPAACSVPQLLKRGAYQLTVEFAQPSFDDSNDVCKQTTGFQLKYSGPDSANRLIAIPLERLFRDFKDNTFAQQIDAPGGAAKRVLEQHFTSTLRDIRRTYQRAFKALLFVYRFALSAKPVADDGQSEIGYLLAHPEHFGGVSYYRQGGTFAPHRAYLDFNFLPVGDTYFSPTPSQDRRMNPSVKRQQALFDWWERLFDYTTMRKEAQGGASEHPVWLAFHEAAEAHPDDPAHLLRHMGVDLRHAALALRYYDTEISPLYAVSSADLEDERWAGRVWQAEKWIRSLLLQFFTIDIRDAKPALWASDDPILAVTGEAQTGNDNLTRFVRQGCVENREPRRYGDVKGLNNGLRERGRQALSAYLCGMRRVALPWGGFASMPEHLSELLLMDVEAGLCQRASRIEEAISAVQIFIQRCRLGLEKTFVPSPAFTRFWDGRFSTYRIWEACKRRELYLENWIDWEELKKAQSTEGFRLLEAELRRATLPTPVPGGLEYWPNHQFPIHRGIALLQAREPASIHRLTPGHEGFSLLGTRERHARPAWLVRMKEDNPALDPPIGHVAEGDGTVWRAIFPNTSKPVPLWIESAIRLGTPFIRVAAAGEPPASTAFDALPSEGLTECCSVCDRSHPAVLDEYYFWLVDSHQYEKIKQDVKSRKKPHDEVGTEAQAIANEGGSGWHNEEDLPTLLHWPSVPSAHLVWCRLHNGEFQQPRQSYEGVRLATSSPLLNFLGRAGDSLSFEVVGGAVPAGHTASTPPGFRYDMVTDTAVVLPLVAATQTVPTYHGGLSAHPYFIYYASGSSLEPPSFFSPAVSVGNTLRGHCRFEAALKWYELAFNPLRENNAWCLSNALQTSSDGVVPGGEHGAEIREVFNEGGVPVDDPSRDGQERTCCQSAPVSDDIARSRSITLHYLETLLQWGDTEMRRNSREAFQHARLIFDTAARILGTHPQSEMQIDPKEPAQKIASFVPCFAPLNPRLLNLYDLVRDRLSLIRTCLNASRLQIGGPNRDMPYWPQATTGDYQPNDQLCADEVDWCGPHNSYRFLFLVQKSQEIASEARDLGAALLAAYEKGDAEYLGSLRASHERQLLNLALEIRQNQWRDADWQVQALQKTKEVSLMRKRYYEVLLRNGLSNGEIQYQALTGASVACRTESSLIEAIAQAVGSAPDMWKGVAGWAGTPLVFMQMPIGSKGAGVLATSARVTNLLAEIASSTGSTRVTEAGWGRREEEWRHQIDVLDIELEQIERQILGAERRSAIALRELNNHQWQFQHSAEVQDFLRDKFSNHALYLWLQKETAALHSQMYELALHTARQAERAFNYERGYRGRTFLPTDTWDTLHEGLLAGERLKLSLRHMEKAFLDENVREYELTKRISMRVQFPLALLCLRATGICEIDIPEWMFDLDYPGHYLRRIKSVSLSLPCVVGDYTGVHCRLTLLSSMTRVEPKLTEPSASCCSDGRLSNGYPAFPNDPRILRQYAATEAIATSSGKNDSGMFDVNFRDERYLPFEFAGAVSRWRIELPRENNQFDVDSLSDVIIHLNYTAREGGNVLRRAANEVAQRHLLDGGVQFFDVKHEFQDARQIFQQGPIAGKPAREFRLRLERRMFPYLSGGGEMWVNRLQLFLEVAGAEPSANGVVEFLVSNGPEDEMDCSREYNVQLVNCAATVEWPHVYHGILNVQLGPLTQDGYRDFGTFRFPDTIGKISRAILLCSYNVHHARSN